MGDVAERKKSKDDNRVQQAGYTTTLTTEDVEAQLKDPQARAATHIN